MEGRSYTRSQAAVTAARGFHKRQAFTAEVHEAEPECYLRDDSREQCNAQFFVEEEPEERDRKQQHCSSHANFSIGRPAGSLANRQRE